MSILTRHLKETLTLWTLIGSDGYGGWTFNAPVTILGRWQEKQELFVDGEGNEVSSAATAHVDLDVAIGDYLSLGDDTATANPTSLSNAHRIRQYSRVTDLRLLQANRKVFL